MVVTVFSFYLKDKTSMLLCFEGWVDFSRRKGNLLFYMREGVGRKAPFYVSSHTSSTDFVL